ncbi:hypothetical protein [Rhizobium sp.]
MLTRHAATSGHDTLLPEIRLHAEATIDYFQRNRRFMRFVDTRQKWLLVHLIAVTCENAGEGPVDGAAANWICGRASDLGIASRNTALAFFNQLAAYGYLERKNHLGDRRIKLISLAQATERALADWTRMLVEIVAGRDAGALDHEALMAIYLGAAKTLLEDARWVGAPLDVALTQDMRGGWLVMAEILRHLAQRATGEPWIPAPGLSIPAMTASFGLSRSTLYRLVRVSVEAGIMAWETRRSVSTLMLNVYHVRQYSRWIDKQLDAVSVAHERVIGERSSALTTTVTRPCTTGAIAPGREINARTLI